MKINKLKSHSGSLGSYDYSQMLLFSQVFEKIKRDKRMETIVVIPYSMSIFIIVTQGLLSFTENIILYLY